MVKKATLSVKQTQCAYSEIEDEEVGKIEIKEGIE